LHFVTENACNKQNVHNREQEVIFYSSLSQEFNYNKLITIIPSIMSRIYAFIIRYKDDPEKTEFYHEFFKSRFKFIDETSLD